MYLLNVGKKDNHTIMRILTFLNKQDIRVITLNLSTQQLEKTLKFAVPDSKAYHEISFVHGYSNRINCIKASKYFSVLKTYYHINETSILSSKSLNNDFFLTILFRTGTLYYLSENTWIISSPAMSVAKIIKVNPSTQQFTIDDKCTPSLNLTEHIFALNYQTTDSLYVQVTQTFLSWIFTGKNPNEIKINLEELIRLPDFILSSAAVGKGTIYLAIHNQLHVINYKTSLIQKTKDGFKEKLKYRILKVKNQISKLWVLNDFNIIMIQYFDLNKLFICKVLDDGKELKVLNEIDVYPGKLKSVTSYACLYNGTNFNTFLLSFSTGELQCLQVSNDIMNHKSESEYLIFLSERQKLFQEELILLPLDAHLPFNAAQAEKNKEEYHILATTSNSNYLLSFQKCVMRDQNDFYPAIRIQQLRLEKIPEVAIPFALNEKKINALTYFHNQNTLNCLTIQLKPTSQAKQYETDKRIISSLQIGNYTVVLTFNMFLQKLYLELINDNYQTVDELELPSEYEPRSLIYMEKLNLILLAGYRTSAVDENPDDLFSQNIKKEKITTILLIGISGIPLPPNYEFCYASKDLQNIVQPSIDGVPREKFNLLFLGGFKLSGEIREIQSIVDNYLLLRKEDSILLLRIFNKPACIEVLNEFFIYNKSIEEIRGEFSNEDLEYFVSQKLLENNIQILSTLLYRVKQIGTNTGVYVFWLCLLTRNGEFHLVEFSTDKKTFKPLSVIKDFEDCDKIFGKDNNKILLRQHQTDIIEITIQEGVVSREFSEDYVFQITKKSVYSGSGKILSVAPGSLASQKEILFNTAEKYEEILSISEDTGKHFEAPKKKLSEIIHLMYL